MTFVKAHERKTPGKSPEYIETHMALMTRAEQRIAFARRHGVVFVEHPGADALVEHSDADHSSERKSIIDRFAPWFGRRA